MSVTHLAVEAELNYLRDTGRRPVNYTFDPPPGVPRNSGEIDTRRVSIRNARVAGEADGLGLERSGFQLVSHRSALLSPADYADSAKVEAIYYPEIETVLRKTTGAEKVVVFDHTLRDGTPDHGRDGVREPVRRVHDDQTFESAPRRVPKHLPKDEAEWRLKRRFAIINFWRPIGEPVQSSPLAMCDARSITPTDLVTSDLVYRDWTGETYAFLYNPKHRWYYYPEQRPDEVTLLKIFDSQTDGTARLTAHTAFDDPSSVANAPPRRSIEARALVFW